MELKVPPTSASCMPMRAIDLHPCGSAAAPRCRLSVHNAAPNLGVVRVDSERSFVIATFRAVEGAAERRLGHRSCAICSARGCCCIWSIPAALGRPEIRCTSGAIVELQVRPEVLKGARLVLNKIDMVDEAERAAVVEQFVKDYDWQGPVFAISALDSTGCTALTYAIMDHLATQAAVILEDEPAADLPAADLSAPDLPAAD
jgi:GTP-binding protein